MSEPKKLKFMNLVIMPRSGHSFYNVIISNKLLYVIIAFISIVFIFNIFFLSKYMKIRHLAGTESTTRVDEQMENLKEEAEAIREELESIKETSQQIEQLTGISSDPRYVGQPGKGTGMPTRNYNTEVEKVRKMLGELRHEVLLRKRTVRETESQVSELVERFARIPSIKPVRNGRLTSGFGYRSHPISRRREFHRGLDIKGSYTTPIHVSADGIVKFSRWRAGYGRTVIVDHENGFETLYAHTYRNLVKKGEQVKKGQVIGYVGSSGTTTGSHLHYEVHYKGRLLNPVKFLSLTYKDIEKY